MIEDLDISEKNTPEGENSDSESKNSKLTKRAFPNHPDPRARNLPVGKRWTKGVSGNPSGKPKKDVVEAALQRVMDQEIPDSWLTGRLIGYRGEGLTFLEMMMLVQAHTAMFPGKKNKAAATAAFNALMDRHIGPVLRNVKVDHTHTHVELSDEDRRIAIAQIMRKAQPPVIDAEFVDDVPRLPEAKIANDSRSGNSGTSSEEQSDATR
ncbi:MAG: hypothetical protein JWQ87_3924 [Candidatus Sulfotelmatobacter sp.]|nr:hypothetical protein [Candidatus Sulfotelmatobacter sp.]